MTQYYREVESRAKAWGLGLVGLKQETGRRVQNPLSFSYVKDSQTPPSKRNTI